jgi:hypothetical protein
MIPTVEAMMTPMAPLDTLAAYLTSCGGCDRYEFHDAHGNADPAAARSFAENLRERFASTVGHAVTIDQVANRVTVCVASEPAPV